MIRVAFGSVPKDGGTYTFYRNQRPQLLKHGIDMRCVTVGKREADIVESSYIDEGCVFLAQKERKLKKQAQVFVAWCEENKIDVVIGVNSEAILAALPHLPEKVRVISRCANAFDEGYRYATVCQQRYAAMVALTPRLQQDLVAYYHAEHDLFRLIPNGIDVKRFQTAAECARGQNEVLELGFLGRLEHKQKGVLYLPEIVRQLREKSVSFRLRIAGKGKRREELESMMEEAVADGQVEFVGQLIPEEIPSFLGSLDVFVFTSHFEGCPNALLEAMMAGCVPVSWVIEGITDFLIKDSETGMLVPMADIHLFASKIVELSQQRDRIDVMSRSVSQYALENLSSQQTSNAYAQLFKDVLAQDPPRWRAKEWRHFKPDSALTTSLRMRLIRRAKWLKRIFLKDK